MAFVKNLAACALVLSSLCAAIPAGKYVLHEARSEHMGGLAKRSKLPGTHTLPIRIGLTQSGLEEGHDWLMDVAHPESANYGKHWTAAEVNKAFAPTLDTIQAVREWLTSSGINHRRITISDNGGWLAFDASVEEAEKLFMTQYHEYGHWEEDKYTLGVDR
jgi:tripeptidyl-peptidase-1